MFTMQMLYNTVFLRTLKGSGQQFLFIFVGALGQLPLRVPQEPGCGSSFNQTSGIFWNIFVRVYCIL